MGVRLRGRDRVSGREGRESGSRKGREGVSVGVREGGEDGEKGREIEGGGGRA